MQGLRHSGREEEEEEEDTETEDMREGSRDVGGNGAGARGVAAAEVRPAGSARVEEALPLVGGVRDAAKDGTAAALGGRVWHRRGGRG